MVSAIRKHSSGVCNTHILLGRASGQVCGTQRQSTHLLWHDSLLNMDWLREAGLKAHVLVPGTLQPQGKSPEMSQLFSSQMMKRCKESKLAHSRIFSIDLVGVRCWVIHKADACYIAPWMPSSRKCFVGVLEYKVDIWLPKRNYMHMLNHNVFHLLVTKTVLRAQASHAIRLIAARSCEQSWRHVGLALPVFDSYGPCCRQQPSAWIRGPFFKYLIAW